MANRGRRGREREGGEEEEEGGLAAAGGSGWRRRVRAVRVFLCVCSACARRRKKAAGAHALTLTTVATRPYALLWVPGRRRPPKKSIVFLFLPYTKAGKAGLFVHIGVHSSYSEGGRPTGRAQPSERGLFWEAKGDSLKNHPPWQPAARACTRTCRLPFCLLTARPEKQSEGERGRVRGQGRDNTREKWG